jgi:hypothetical protein
MFPCEGRITLERWIIDNKVILKRCFADQTGGRRPDDYYEVGCDGRPARELYDKLVDLILMGLPLERRFDENGYHIECRQDHCNFTHNFVQ